MHLLTEGKNAYSVQTNNNYAFSYDHENLHITVSISSCSWYELHMEIPKHIVDNCAV
jgi:hypothetical protein